MVDRPRVALRRRPQIAHGEIAPLLLPKPLRNIPVASLDGTRLHASVYGNEDAPTLVLAHGITQQQRHWAYQVADLAADYRIVLFDHRGHGRSGRSSSYTIADLGDDLQSILATCVPPGERAVIAGHSLGGITIMSWASQHPGEVADRAAATLLVNTAPSEIAQHLLMIGLPKQFHGAVPYVVRERLMTILRTRARMPIRMLALGPTANPAFVTDIVAMLADAPGPTLRHLITDLLLMDLTDRLHCLDVPTVVISGERDRLLPKIHSDHIAARLPKLEQHVTIPGSGHMSPWEARETVSGLIADIAKSHLA